MNLNPNESDPLVLWAEIHRLRYEQEAPLGFSSWKDAAEKERVLRLRTEQQLRQVNNERILEANSRRVKFIGVDPLNLTRGAYHPMIPDSWRFGFYEQSGQLLFGHRDDGPLVAVEAIED